MYSLLYTRGHLTVTFTHGINNNNNNKYNNKFCMISLQQLNFVAEFYFSYFFYYLLIVIDLICYCTGIIQC